MEWKHELILNYCKTSKCRSLFPLYCVNMDVIVEIFVFDTMCVLAALRDCKCFIAVAVCHGCSRRAGDPVKFAAMQTSLLSFLHPSPITTKPLSLPHPAPNFVCLCSLQNVQTYMYCFDYNTSHAFGVSNWFKFSDSVHTIAVCGHHSMQWPHIVQYVGRLISSFWMVIGRSIGWSFIDWLDDLKVGDRVHAVCQATVFLFFYYSAHTYTHKRLSHRIMSRGSSTAPCLKGLSLIYATRVYKITEDILCASNVPLRAIT